MSNILKRIFGKKNTVESEAPVHLTIDQKPGLSKKERKALLKQYFIGVDVSTGTSADYSSYCVMDRNGNEVESYKDKIHLFVKEQKEMNRHEKTSNDNTSI